MNDLKTTVLLSTSDGERVDIIMKEFWKCYDFDGSGKLNQEEARKFINQIMPEMMNDPSFVPSH